LLTLRTQGATLRKTQVVGIRRPPTADSAGLFDDMPDVIAVTDATRFWKR
jgi:hypothetical protein